MPRWAYVPYREQMTRIRGNGWPFPVLSALAKPWKEAGSLGPRRKRSLFHEGARATDQPKSTGWRWPVLAAVAGAVGEKASLGGARHVPVETYQHLSETLEQAKAAWKDIPGVVDVVMAGQSMNMPAFLLVYVSSDTFDDTLIPDEFDGLEVRTVVGGVPAGGW